jgi:hypothetical protein
VIDREDDLPARREGDEQAEDDDGVVELGGEDLACVCLAIVETVEEEPAEGRHDLPGLEPAGDED